VQFDVRSVIIFLSVGSYRPAGVRAGRRVHLVSCQNLSAVPSTRCRGSMEIARVPYRKNIVLRRSVGMCQPLSQKQRTVLIKQTIPVDIRKVQTLTWLFNLTPHSTNEKKWGGCQVPGS
jgi:hypothetical protein